MSTVQIRDLPAATSLDGTELVELQKAAGGVGSSEQTPNGALLPPGYIDGLKMQWVSANAVTVGSGAAYIPSLGRVVRASTAIALSGLALAASTWYHVYLYLNAGTPTIECVTTAPAAAYYGTARTKTGDTSRRYIGSVLANASGNVCAFLHAGNAIKYLENANAAPFIVLTAGTATSPTNVSCSGAVPVTGTLASLVCLNADTSVMVSMSNSSAAFTLTSSAYLTFVYHGSTSSMDFPLDSSQQFNYMFASAPTGTMYVRAVGYVYER